MRLRFPALNR
ncbi:MAG: hypothetical protein GX030_08525 [Firmicutes bacterium]|nr:hypothetical protein [Bacillota bacterium]